MVVVIRFKSKCNFGGWRGVGGSSGGDIGGGADSTVQYCTVQYCTVQ